jgi:hexosaminidase
VLSSDETLQFGFDESYSVYVPTDENRATITAQTVYGALRGLGTIPSDLIVDHLSETFAQLVVYGWQGGFHIPNAPINITDQPRFSYRGLLLDSARHYIPMKYFYQAIDGMAASKVTKFLLMQRNLIFHS